jgi:hypothetical protein
VPSSSGRAASVAALALLAACSGTLSPFRRHAVVGQDAYLVFVGDGPEGRSDLFGVRGDGGPVFQLTYTAVAELAPALSPNGAMLAFLRPRAPRDTLPGAVWVMNLLNGAERELPLPANAGRPERIGWSHDGRTIWVRAGAQDWRLAAPPAPPAPRPTGPAERAEADSSFGVFLGDPPFTRVVTCDGALCARGDTGAPAPFAAGGRDPVRWGGDSVGDTLTVRSLGPGRPRQVQWSGAPRRPRELTYFPGRE